MSTPDADDQLRQTVQELAARKECTWAGIYFVEDENLALGPESGTPDPARRTTVPAIAIGSNCATGVTEPVRPT